MRSASASCLIRSQQGVLWFGAVLLATAGVATAVAFDTPNAPPGGREGEPPAPPPQQPEQQPDAQRPDETPGDLSAAADDVSSEYAALERTAIGKWEQLESFSAKLELENVRGDDRAKQRRTRQGTFDYLRKDDKALIRVEMSGGSPDSPNVMRMVADGETIHLYREAFNMRDAAKYAPKHAPLIEIGGREMFEKMRRVNRLKLMPDEKVEGRTVHVVAGEQREGDSSALYYIDDMTGAMIKSVVTNPSQQTVTTMTITDVRVNVSFDADHFKFTVPEGVEVKDFTHSAEPASGEAPDGG